MAVRPLCLAFGTVLALPSEPPSNFFRAMIETPPLRLLRVLLITLLMIFAIMAVVPDRPDESANIQPPVASPLHPVASNP